MLGKLLLDRQSLLLSGESIVLQTQELPLLKKNGLMGIVILITSGLTVLVSHILNHLLQGQREIARKVR